MKILAFNDMLGKGWDSAAQYSFCIQKAEAGDPQFWWVWETLKKFPHPPEWQYVRRGPGGRYVSFPGGRAALKHQLVRYASDLIGKGFKEEAKVVCSLIKELK